MNDERKKALGEIKRIAVEQKEKRDAFFDKVSSEMKAFIEARIEEGSAEELTEQFAHEITDMLTLRTTLENVIPELKSLDAITMCLVIIGIFASPNEAGTRGVLNRLSLGSKQESIESLFAVIDGLSEFLKGTKNDGTAEYLLNSGTINKLKC